MVNLKDLMRDTFKINIEDDISWQLMPLGLKPPIDPVSYITRSSFSSPPLADDQSVGGLAYSIINLH
jgi:hypothetical protein